MNKILLENEVVSRLKKTEVEFTYHMAKSLFDITKLHLIVKKDCEILLNIKRDDDLKLDLVIDILDDASVIFNMIDIVNKAKIKTTVNLGKNSRISFDKVNNCSSVKEGIIFNFNDEFACCDYNFKSVSENNETYDIVINHQASNTVSNVKNNIINYTGNVLIQVSTYIDKFYKNVLADQKNTIININNKKCEIKPNLFIDSFDSVANHSAYIGKFDKNKLFYLMSRGLSEKEAYHLLIKGFLESDVENKQLLRVLDKMIKKYWR